MPWKGQTVCAGSLLYVMGQKATKHPQVHQEFVNGYHAVSCAGKKIRKIQVQAVDDKLVVVGLIESCLDAF